MCSCKNKSGYKYSAEALSPFDVLSFHKQLQLLPDAVTAPGSVCLAMMPLTLTTEQNQLQKQQYDPHRHTEPTGRPELWGVGELCQHNWETWGGENFFIAIRNVCE